MIFNIYGLINLINAFCALTITAIIFFKKGRKPIQITYGSFSFLLFFYGFFYWLWSTETNASKALFWFNILMYPVCVIHAFYFHFTLVICNKVNTFKRILISTYILSFLFSILNYSNVLYDLEYVRARPPFLYWPHALPMLAFLVLFEAVTVCLSLCILAVSAKNSTDSTKLRYKYLFIAGFVGWAGAVTNWIHFYDSIFIPQFGNSMISIYLLFTFYLIFKHDLLNLNLAIKRTFVYTLLTLSISLIYALFVTLSERFFHTYIGYSSFIGSVFAALTIAVMFIPLRDSITKFIDKRFFGKSIQELSQENIQMREYLQNQDRMKAAATLAAGMAHEIKNPLTSIKTFAEYLPKKYDDPDFREKFSRIVSDEVDRVNSILKQLLEFSKPSPLEMKAFLVSNLIEETMNLLSNNVLKARVYLYKDLDPYAMVVGDRNRLKQAFLNLMLNGLQSIENGGRLEILTKTEPSGLVRIAITDSGCGMSRDQVQHAFDPFFTTKEEGTGLGLAIVHGIITKHGGKIEIHSEVGKGTVVNVFLKSRD